MSTWSTLQFSPLVAFMSWVCAVPILNAAIPIYVYFQEGGFAASISLIVLFSFNTIVSFFAITNMSRSMALRHSKVTGTTINP